MYAYAQNRIQIRPESVTHTCNKLIKLCQNHSKERIVRLVPGNIITMTS